ncbi:hypothetical protein SAMN05443287_106208 [Micromonospora phaseoli]|uniref:Uncharacterized protein n=1 Tax=Micromonospora phaseoli TaxID=1144548 RepID=A0A1H7ALU7_9ACTN|nr:hypothetical protein [Micromonospora phaseoli]PZV96303.1 hypothetical protein CLV64_107181 [Micromonospora phaseoli]GIJ75982.1 hypothetical protein Xph01_04140 [Micromonospora phaseoli]SEJ66358.1 hypothetical protein SAMN05443287_106208 [Micromonospora phaseoli]
MSIHPDFFNLGLLFLLAWTATLAALVVLVLGVARFAFKKARAQDVPEVLLALARIVGLVPWLGQLASVARALPNGPSNSATPQLPPTSHGSSTPPGADQSTGGML